MSWLLSTIVPSDTHLKNITTSGNLFQPKFMRVFLILQNKRSIVDNNKNNKHIIGFQILLTFIGKMGIIGDVFAI